MGNPDASSEAYQSLRPLMFAIAYRMLGSVSEAEDIVQEAFLHYHRALTRPGASGTGGPGTGGPGPGGPGPGGNRPRPTCRRSRPGCASTTAVRRGSGARRTWASGCLSRCPIVGRDRVGRLLAGLGQQASSARTTMRPAQVNGQPGALFFAADGTLAAVMTVDIADGRVYAVRSIISRDKLRHLGPLADWETLISQVSRPAGRPDPPAR